MNTPVNGPRTENGSETISVATANPTVVLWSSGENTTDATSAAWNRPSADCDTSRIANRRRKSWLRSAARARPIVPCMPAIVGARPRSRTALGAHDLDDGGVVVVGPARGDG